MFHENRFIGNGNGLAFMIKHQNAKKLSEVTITNAFYHFYFAVGGNIQILLLNFVKVRTQVEVKVCEISTVLKTDRSTNCTRTN